MDLAPHPSGAPLLEGAPHDAPPHDPPASDPADPATSDPAVTATRQRVLGAVVQDGPVTAADLSASIGLTAAAVRRHLDALVAEGRVSSSDLVRTGTRGRPARAFSATSAGRAAVSTALRGTSVEGGDLATLALRHVAATSGRAGVAAVAEERARALAARYEPAVSAAGDDLRSRVGALAAALSGDGYAASSRAVLPPLGRSGTAAAPSAVQLCQGSCPVQQVASEFPELCEAETRAFGELLGTHVRRLATLAHGEHVCTTHVPLYAPGRAAAAGAPQTSTPQTSTTTEHASSTSSTGGTAPR